MRVSSVFESTLKWTHRSQVRCVSFQTIESTSTYAKNHAFDSDGLVLYLADVQTAGRGRGMNVWSDAGSGQCFSGTFKLDLDRSPQPILSPLMGLALFEAAQHAFPKFHWSLKAPNDLYLQDKKIAGLLIEIVAKGTDISLLIGLGINILSSPSAVPTATSLCGPYGFNGDVAEPDWFAFLNVLRERFEVYLKMGLQGELADSQRVQLLSALSRCPVKTSDYLDITKDGDLITSTVTISWKDL